MKVGPSESASRSGLQTTPSCCGQKSLVVSVGVKALGKYPKQVWVRETNDSEPPMTRRNPKDLSSKPGTSSFPGMSLSGIWVLGRRRPAFRGRESDLGSRVELREPVLGCKGRSTSGRNHEARVPMPDTGADRLVVAMKAGNAAGAKGSGQAVVFIVQLETGGDV